MPRVGGVARWRAAALGAAAAVAAPTVLSGARLDALLRDAPRTRRVSAERDEVAFALAVSSRLLRILDRRFRWLRFDRRPWRDSCLYRSVAQCLVLRWYGRAARVALGAGRLDRDAVGAHAWVEYDGPEPVERPAPDFVTFRPSVGRR